MPLLRRLACLVPFAAAATACGEPGVAVTCDANARYPLQAPLEAHACMHQQSGPFETLAASSVAMRSPELRNPHTAYQVTLPETSSGHQGWVTFRPRDTAAYAFFIDADVPVKLVPPGEDETAALCPASDLRATSVCPALPRIRFYDLERKLTYALLLGPSSQPNITVIVEQHFND